MKLTLLGSNGRSRLAWFMKSFNSTPRIWGVSQARKLEFQSKFQSLNATFNYIKLENHLLSFLASLSRARRLSRRGGQGGHVADARVVEGARPHPLHRRGGHPDEWWSEKSFHPDTDLVLCLKTRREDRLKSNYRNIDLWLLLKRILFWFVTGLMTSTMQYRVGSVITSLARRLRRLSSCFEVKLRFRDMFVYKSNNRQRVKTENGDIISNMIYNYIFLWWN